MPHLIPCEAGCRRLFHTVGAMQTHLTMATSCKWYMKGKFREWEEEEVENVEEASLEIEELVLGSDGTGVEEYNPEEDDNLYHDEGDLGPSDFFFIPGDAEVARVEEEILVLGEQGPGPETAAQRIQQHSYRILDDDCDERVTEPHPLAGRIKKKVPPPSLRSAFQREEVAEDDMDVDKEDNLFYPFNSELDWRIAQWAIKDNPGQNAFDRLLAVPGVSRIYITWPMLIPVFLGC